VDWQPLLGTLPPLNQESWEKVFQQYQLFPQYQKVNLGMSLQDFKAIFYWEYFHRLLGRLIGLVYLLPLIYFHIKGNLSSSLKKQLNIGFVLGGLQGLLGWYMVKSGLVNNPHVSHFRLAAHLGLAFFVSAYLFWIYLDTDNRNCFKKPNLAPLTTLSLLSCTLIFQIIYGAFTAGLKAGMIYNTFPKMNGAWTPFEWVELTPFYKNFIYDLGGIQWVHRTTAWLLLLLVIYLSSYIKDYKSTPRLLKSVYIFISLFILQFLLGVMTLLTQVKIHWASMHQLGAFLLILSLTNLWFQFLKPQK